MARTSTKTSAEIEVISLRMEEVSFCLLGTTPFYANRVAEKAKRELLMPRGRLTTAQKANNLKHDPVVEFRSSPYLRVGPGPTRIMMYSTAIKGAIAQAAIDMPTAVAKTQINRLVSISEEFIPIWGIPRLNMAIVRSADMARTPDVRTRAKIDKWASRVTLRYVVPMLSSRAVSTLLAAAGLIIGIGDFRQEKGKGHFGLFEIVPEDDPEYRRVIAGGGMDVQDEALAHPVCSDSETEDLLSWYTEELAKRTNTPANTDEPEPEEEPVAAE